MNDDASASPLPIPNFLIPVGPWAMRVIEISLSGRYVSHSGGREYWDGRANAMRRWVKRIASSPTLVHLLSSQVVVITQHPLIVASCQSIKQQHPRP